MRKPYTYRCRACRQEFDEWREEVDRNRSSGCPCGGVAARRLAFGGLLSAKSVSAPAKEEGVSFSPNVVVKDSAAHDCGAGGMHINGARVEVDGFEVTGTRKAITGEGNAELRARTVTHNPPSANPLDLK